MMMANKRMISTSVLDSTVAQALWQGSKEKYPHAMLIFLALLSHADDWGRGKYSPYVVRGWAFNAAPSVRDSTSDEEVDGWVRIMCEEGTLALYGENKLGEPLYYAFPKWDMYQKLDYRKISLLPEPPGYEEPEHKPAKPKPAAKPKPKPKPAPLFSSSSSSSSSSLKSRPALSIVLPRKEDNRGLG